MRQTLPAILFAVCVGTVYAVAVQGVLRLVRQRTMKAVSSFHRIAFALGAVGLLCIGYGYFIEPNWLEITHVEIESSKIPVGRRPIRIIHFSDLHSEQRPRLDIALVRHPIDGDLDLHGFTPNRSNACCSRWNFSVGKS